MNNFVTRTISGAIFVSLLIAAILFNEYSFVALFAVLSGLATAEFHKITNTVNTNVNSTLAVIGSVLLFCSTYLYTSHHASNWVFSIYGIYLLVILLLELYRKNGFYVNNWAFLVFGQLYTALPFALLNSILFINGYEPYLLLALFVTIWVNDSGAYIIGVSFGKNRLFERISPKKSWEGFFGGAAFALLSAYIFSIYLPYLNVWKWFIFSEIIVIAGTYGDLFESLLKRNLNIKDSGNTIPGHGGILDRFDSMIFAAPAVYFYLTFIFK